MNGVANPGAPVAESSRRSAPMSKLYNRLAREDGQTMAEYGVVLTVITFASLTALAYLSESIMKRMLTVASFLH
jgi:Flp pilus assembly pilin Flp